MQEVLQGTCNFLTSSQLAAPCSFPTRAEIWALLFSLGWMQRSHGIIAIPRLMNTQELGWKFLLIIFWCSNTNLSPVLKHCSTCRKRTSTRGSSKEHQPKPKQIPAQITTKKHFSSSQDKTRAAWCMQSGATREKSRLSSTRCIPPLQPLLGYCSGSCLVLVCSGSQAATAQGSTANTEHLQNH